MKRAKGVRNNAGFCQYKCPHCGNVDTVVDLGALTGMSEEDWEEEIANCLNCGQEYVRESPEEQPQ